MAKVNRKTSGWIKGLNFKVLKPAPRPPWEGKRDVKMKRWRKREASTESAVVRKVKDELGIVSRKMNGLGFNSWPDRMFMLPGGKPLFIEFKRKGKEPTDLQLENHKILRSLGYEVQVHDDAVKAFDSVKRHSMEALRSAKARHKVSSTARRRRAVP